MKRSIEEYQVIRDLMWNGIDAVNEARPLKLLETFMLLDEMNAHRNYKNRIRAFAKRIRKGKVK